MTEKAEKKERKKRDEFVIRVSPAFMKIIEEQMERIMDVTHGVIKGSTWEASEILAKKFKGEV